LDGREVRLHLPSVVGRSVVGESELPVRHGPVRTVTQQGAGNRE